MSDSVRTAIRALEVRVRLLSELAEALEKEDYHAACRAEAAIPGPVLPGELAAAMRELRPKSTVDPAPDRQ